jgi:hypothetical protein
MYNYKKPRETLPLAAEEGSCQGAVELVLSQQLPKIYDVCRTMTSLEVGEDGCRERCHGLASVCWDDSLQSWNSALDLSLGKESEDSKHGKTSVVDLFNKSVGLVFF